MKYTITGLIAIVLILITHALYIYDPPPTFEPRIEPDVHIIPLTEDEFRQLQDWLRRHTDVRFPP